MTVVRILTSLEATADHSLKQAVPRCDQCETCLILCAIDSQNSSFVCHFKILPYLQTNQGRASNANPKCKRRRKRSTATLAWGLTSTYDDASEAFNVSFASKLCNFVRLYNIFPFFILQRSSYENTTLINVPSWTADFILFMSDFSTCPSSLRMSPDD